MKDSKKIIAEYTEILKRLKTVKKDAERMFGNIDKKSRSDLSKCKKSQDKADLLASLLQFAGGQAKLVQDGLKASKAAGDDLVKINKAVLKDFAKDKRSNMAPLIGDAVRVDTSSDGAAVMLGKAAFKAWADMNKVSFWAAAYVDVIDNKNFHWDPVKWSKFSDEIYKKSKKRTDAIRTQSLKQLDAKIKKYEDLVKKLKNRPLGAKPRRGVAGGEHGGLQINGPGWPKRPPGMEQPRRSNGRVQPLATGKDLLQVGQRILVIAPGAGIANLFAPGRMRPAPRLSGGYLEGVAVPKIEGIGSGVAVGKSGKAIAARAEDRVDLVMGRQKSLRLSG